MITEQTVAVYDNLLQFLDRLDESAVPYHLARVRREAIMVQFALPGERWEVEFLDDGAIEVERFASDGTIRDEVALQDLWAILAADADRPS
jgi:hypothetical protein